MHSVGYDVGYIVALSYSISMYFSVSFEHIFGSVAGILSLYHYIGFNIYAFVIAEIFKYNYSHAVGFWTSLDE